MTAATTTVTTTTTTNGTSPCFHGFTFCGPPTCRSPFTLLQSAPIRTTLSRHFQAAKAHCYSNPPRSGRSGDRIPLLATICTPVQTGPYAQSAFCTTGTVGKRRERRLDFSPLSSAEVKERIELYLYSASGPTWPVIG